MLKKGQLQKRKEKKTEETIKEKPQQVRHDVGSGGEAAHLPWSSSDTWRQDLCLLL